MSLETEYAGLTLKNPILVAAGPWSRSGAAMQRAIDAGAAAVVTETITLEASRSPSPRLFLGPHPEQLFNTMLYSEMQLEQWEQEFEGLRRGDCRIIASIWGGSPSELGYLAGKVERMGADAVEVSISAPLGTRNETINSYPQEICSYLRAAVEAVDIPVIVKLSYEAAGSRSFLAALTRAGVAGVTAMDSLKGLRGVDLETCRARMPTYGGYSGAAIHPVALAVVATLKQLTSLPVCGCGGVRRAEDVLEFLMLGACGAQVASGLLQEGYGLIPRILGDLEQWLEAHGHRSVKEITGLALDSLRPFEEISPRPLTVRLAGSCDGCGQCMAGCLYDALHWEDGALTVHPARCTGCGLCVERCPRGALQLEWEEP